MGRYKTILNCYVAWDHEKEADDLNNYSIKGLHLIQGGLIRYKFEQDDSIVYRYQIDFNPNIDNKPEYINVFKEQGWQYINSTFNGWHYFRKKYDNFLSQNEYEIYTDRPSKIEMTKRWSKFVIPILIFIGIAFVYNLVKLILTPELSRIGLVLYCFVLTMLLITGLKRMRKVANGKKLHRNFD